MHWIECIRRLLWAPNTAVYKRFKKKKKTFIACLAGAYKCVGCVTIVVYASFNHWQSYALTISDDFRKSQYFFNALLAPFSLSLLTIVYILLQFTALISVGLILFPFEIIAEIKTETNKTKRRKRWSKNSHVLHFWVYQHAQTHISWYTNMDWYFVILYCSLLVAKLSGTTFFLLFFV